ERRARRALRGRRELHGLIDLDRRCGRGDVDGGARWGRWRRWWRWWRWWRRDVERVAGREGERSRGRLQHVASPRLVDAQIAEARDARCRGDGDGAVERAAGRVRADREREAPGESGRG